MIISGDCPSYWEGGFVCEHRSIWNLPISIVNPDLATVSDQFLHPNEQQFNRQHWKTPKEYVELYNPGNLDLDV